MNVRVEILFDPPDKEAREAMKSLGRSVTNDRRSVRVFAKDGAPGWLMVEFTMPTEAQYKAVGKVDRAVRNYAGARLDSTVGFPRSEAKQARADCKAQRRRANRRPAECDTT